jgi:hypothetical protein
MSRLQVLQVRPNKYAFYLTSHFVSCANTRHNERKRHLFLEKKNRDYIKGTRDLLGLKKKKHFLGTSCIDLTLTDAETALCI